MSRDHSAQKLLFISANRTLNRNAVSQYQFRHVLRCVGEASKLYFISKSGTGSILSPCLVLRAGTWSIFMFLPTKCFVERRICFPVNARFTVLGILNGYGEIEVLKTEDS
jgi:hypothetical protein